ncbi:MAG: hypothetical protein KAH24_08225 [Holophagae bacterium]|nr:hypothetical protein [Holophagae bacterium]
MDWTVDNPAVTTVNSTGLLTAVSEDVIVVMATTTDGSGMSGNIQIVITDDLQRNAWEFTNNLEGCPSVPDYLILDSICFG